VNRTINRRGSRKFRQFVESLECRQLLSVNPIVAENQLPGTPQSVWGVQGAGDATIQGYATDISVNQGQTVSFKINDTASAPYHIDIYRAGYYQGLGARLVTTIASSQTTAKVQPNPTFEATTALVDAGNWSVTASWAVPANATSGVYFARVVRNDTGGASMIPFIVRADTSHSAILFQTADSTWEAYNTWGGYSLYQATGTQQGPGFQGAAYAVSYNRPFINAGTPGGLGVTNWFFYDEYPMVRFLEANGYDVSYFTDMDSDRYGSLIQQHQIFMSTGHDEYWSGGQFNNVMSARDAGVNLAFFSGNEVFWKTRWANSIDGSNTPYRTLVDYKETHANAQIDPLDISQGIWTGTFMDPRFSPPADGGRPQNQLTGQLFTVNRGPSDVGTPFTVPYSDSQLRFWRNTSVASLQSGQTATLGDFELGYEWDEDVDNGFRPAGLIDMSSTTQSVTQKFTDYGNTTAAGTATNSLTLYRASSGALVFGAGMVQYDWGLDANHDDQNGNLGLNSVVVPALQQATVNLFADMNVQPGTLQPGLVSASASTDIIAPTSTITAPITGASILTGNTVTITGTASDSGGGIVGGVEVSVDGGQTWHPAKGTNSWTYTWVPDTAGQIKILSRATDDSGNIEKPKAGVAVSVSYQSTSRTGLVAEYSFNDGTGTTLTDTSGNHNNGTISNATWASGLFGGALSFNGTNSWVTINSATSLNLTSGMTLEAWVNPSALSDWSAVILKERTGGLDYALYADNGANQPPSGYIHTSSGDSFAEGGSAIPLNTWSNLAATYDGANINLYVNGTLVGTDGTSGNMVTSTNALRLGGDSIWGEFFNGLMDQVRIYNRPLNQAELRSDMSTPIGGTLDSTPPTVSLTGPAAGATVSGITAISANASDNVYVGGVQFLLDGQPLSAADTAAPYSISWDTRKAANGNHVLSVQAFDMAGNTTTSSTVTVTVSNPQDTVPPTVRITYPPNGFSATGQVVLNSVASDNTGVASVQYQLNGVNIGQPVTTAPYHILWDAHTVADGNYNLTAVATDISGNVTSSAPVSVTVDHTPPTVTAETPAPGATGVSTAAGVTATFNESVQSGTISFVLKDSSGNVLPSTVSYDDTTHTATLSHGSVALDPLTVYTATVKATDLAGNTMASGFSWSFSTASAIVGATIWNASTVPAVTSANDTGAVEVGVKLRSDVAGVITGVRFYKGGTNTGTHVGHLWSSTGTLLATATFTGETSFGWQQVNFASPVSISANTTYVASYYAPAGGYAADASYFVTAVNSGPLHALADGTDGGDGVYIYGTGAAFPINTFQSTNYWVDVVFNSSSVDTTPPAVTGESPLPNANGVAQNAAVTATFSKSVQPATISFVLKDSTGAAVAGSVAYNSSTNTATFTPTAALNASATYTATVSGAKDLSGNVMSAPFSWSFTTTAPTAPPTVASETPAPGATGVAKGSAISATFSKPIDDTTLSFVLKDSSGNIVANTFTYDDEASTATLTLSAALNTGVTYTATVSGAKDLTGNVMSAPFSWSFTTANAANSVTIWSPTATPAVASANDTGSVELGVKFRSDVAGFITGIRFYKGSLNTGTHVGYLWTSAGAMVASATFTGETASGWQQVNFASPVAIAANTTYVAAYYSPVGGYSYTSAAFASAGVDNAPLHALANGVDGGNGVYGYATGGAFPTNSFNSTNYWVDVVFTTTASGTAPTVVATSPASAATGVTITAPITATFSAPVQPATISFVLKGSSGTAVPATVSYNSTTQTSTLTPSSPLITGVTYTATVSGAQDSSGNTMTPASWSFTTVPSISVWSAVPVPGVPSANDPAAIEVGTKIRSDVAGTVTGVSFYKGASNTGTHVGHLWSSTGQLLASVTFANETASGWQTASFATPVTIQPNATYVISYYAPAGGYSADAGYFTAAGASNGPLHALASGVDGSDGVYAYGTGGAFPNNSFNDTNYWVDAVFKDSLAPVGTAPTVTGETPAPSATGVAKTVAPTVTFNQAVQNISFTLKDSGNNTVAGTVSYNSTSNTATFTPTAALSGNVTYTATVSASSTSGIAMGTPFSWSFTTQGQWVQTTAADFTAGTQTNTAVTNTSGGEEQLAAPFSDTFPGTSLSANWATTSWASQGGGPTSVTVAGNTLSVAGAEVLTTKSISNGVVEGLVTFAAAPYQHFGMATNLNAVAGNSWAIFSTMGTTNTLYARVNASGTTQDVSLGALPTGSHDYKVLSVTGGFQFYVDGVLKTTINLASSAAMKAALSSFGSSAIKTTSVQLGATSGTFVSSVFNAGRTVSLVNASWTASVPAGTTLSVFVRTSSDGTNFSAWTALTKGAAISGLGGQYLQYEVVMTTTSPTLTPVINDITFNFN
jgi:methionine-rich copper-binding protein CopC